MKRTTIVIALAAILGLTLAAIPALAQNEQPPSEPPAVCPFHDQGTMTNEEMDRPMDSTDHEWISSADHDRMHAAMGDMDRTMNGYGPSAGSMMGGMVGSGNMMGRSG